MTLPYPLLARGKIIYTDMSLGQNYAPGLEGAEKIEALERRIKAYQESEMSNAVAVRNQVVLTLFPLLVKDDSSIEDGISRVSDPMSIAIIASNKIDHKVEMYEMVPVLVATFGSISEAAEMSGYSPKRISDAVNQGHLVDGRYKFKKT